MARARGLFELFQRPLRMVGFKKVFYLKYYFARLFCKEVVKDVNDYQMILDLDDSGISKELFSHGKREVVSTDFFSGRLSEGDRVLDVGANIGYYALLESLAVGKTGRVFAVEPSPKNLACLRKNLAINDCKNVEVFELGMAGKEGVLPLFMTKESNLNTMIEDVQFSEKTGEVVRVPVTTVDAFIEEHGRVDFVRMDVEGYETEIIKGMGNALEDGVSVLIEVHSSMIGREATKAFMKTFVDAGYEIEVGIIDPIDWSLNKDGRVGSLRGVYLRFAHKNPMGFFQWDLETVLDDSAFYWSCPHVLFTKKKGIM